MDTMSTEGFRPNGSPAPWNAGVDGEQLLPLINEDARVLRVQAGPGTGKTFGLRRRVLRILHPAGLGIDPGRVLICAFNRAIAHDLRNEIDQELGPHGLERPIIQTVHSLCLKILGESPRFMLPHEIEEMIYDVRAQYPQLNERFGRRQSEAIRAHREHEAGLRDHPDLAAAINRWLADHHAQLVGHAPRSVDAQLRGGLTPERLFEHIVVDEFQDLTETEARVLSRLRTDGGSLVVVGDPKQSIYAFRGNAERGLEALAELVPEAITDRPMNQCRRCPSEIVRLANALMRLEGDPLVDVRGPGGRLSVVHFRTPEAERDRMASEVARVYRARPEERHLVLVTRRTFGYELKNAIRALDPDLPTQTVFAEDVLQTWPAREAFMFLSIVADPADAVALRDWVGYQTPAEGAGFLAPQRNAPAYISLKQRSGVLSMRLVEELAGLQVGELS
jgi:DNA helicase II / ATP-dependent DNA helicase PcrA